MKQPAATKIFNKFNHNYFRCAMLMFKKHFSLQIYNLTNILKITVYIQS